MYVTRKPGNNQGEDKLYEYTRMYGAWAVLLLFAYASFDGLSAFSLEEINGRSKICFQFLGQFVLLLILLYPLYGGDSIVPFVLAFLFACLKVVERIVALAHAAGTTRGIRESLRKMVNYINYAENEDHHEGEFEAHPLSMEGYKYLVGPRYSKTKDDEIVDGITLEKIWGCKGELLRSGSGGGDQDGKLKDTCFSFALFWLLLGKIRGYSSFDAAGSTSRIRAWKLVHDGLLSQQERTFRVIEVELCFLREYFYSKNMFYYLNGFYWKLISLTAFPIMFWYFVESYKSELERINSVREQFNSVKTNFNTKATSTVILILYSLEVIQFFTLITSRWCSDILLCYYVSKREVSCWVNCGLFNWCIEKVVQVVCRVSICTRALLEKPWKRELDQFSLLENCTCFSIDNKYLLSLSYFVGLPLPKLTKKQGKSVPLWRDLKTAVVLSLQTNGPKLSNGVTSLKRNGIDEKISLACDHKRDAETILVWHIATSICEMNPSFNNDSTLHDFEVATKLSKYCAYLLAFAPLLVSVSDLEAEILCETVIKEARALLKKPFSLCGMRWEVSEYNELIQLLKGDKEAQGEQSITMLQKGIKLGEFLNSIEGDEKRWKILAEFWAELTLFLASSNLNEMAHVERIFF